MANEFKVKKGLIVTGSGGTIFDIQGSQGQLFSVTDSLTGELFSVNDISGIPIMTVSSDDSVLMGTYGAEAIKVSGSVATISNLAVTGTTLVTNLNADYLDGQHGSFYASAASLSSYVPTSRTLTINGTTFDLSANRSWTIAAGTGTVTQVNSGNGMNFSNFTTSGTITMGTPSSTTLASTNATTTNSHTHAFAPGGTTAQYITGAGTLVTFPTITNGTVTSVAALTLGTTGTDLSSTVANGSTTPVITLNVPTASAANRGALSATDWSTFNNKQPQLNGTGFVKAVGTTISYDNSTYYLASNPNGYTTNTGTVTAVNNGNGMNFTNFSTSGTITLGTPSSTTLASTNATTTNSHTHAFAPGGTTAQYITGAGTLVTFPTITNGTVTSVAALTLGTTGTDVNSTVANPTTTPVITLNVPDASATARGVINNTTQTIAGTKTFNNTINGTVGSFSQSSAGVTLYANNGGVGGTGVSGGAGNGLGGYFVNNSTTYPVVRLLGLSNTRLLEGRDTSDVITFAVTSAGAVSGSSFIRTGGTSAQFLKADGTVDSTTYVPSARTLTINGTTFDLSANRSWTISGGGTGTVTQVNSGNGMNFSNFTTSGTITMGTPSSTTLASTNATTTNSHTHAFAPGGTTAQYITGAGTLVTFPTIPTVNDGTLTMATSGIATGSASFTANQGGTSTFTVNVPATNLSIGVSSGTQVRMDSSTGADVDIPVASATLAGIVTTGTQTFAGTKTFSSTISGSINGNAATATNAGTATNSDYVYITQAATTNANYLIPFADVTNAYSRLWSDSSRLYYNPSIDTLTVDNLNGNASSATQAANATNVGVTNNTTTNATYYLTFTSGVSGNQALNVDSNTLTFNPSTNTLTVTNLAGTASNSTLLDNIASNRFVFGNNGSGSNGASTTFNPYELSQYKSGFWDVSGASWTPTGDWYWGLTTAHQSNSTSYNYSGQQVYRLDGTESYFRTIAGGSANTWRRIWHDGNITPVPTSRTLTINGTTFDLSANRSWTISGGGSGTVTNVAALTLGTSGTDLNSSVANSTTTPVITLNVPNASATARGVISTGTQTIAGAKTFTSTLVSTGNVEASQNVAASGHGVFRGAATGEKIYVGDPFTQGPIGLWEDSSNTSIAVFYSTSGLYELSNRSIRTELSSGYVCVNNNPSGAGRFEVSGDNNGGGVSIYATDDIVAFSDISVKENIRPIANVLDKVVNSRGIIYDRIDSKTKDNIGFIAQELEEQFPELVTTNPDGTKAVKYQNATAVLFEAVKEQQKQIDSLQEQINNILAKLDK